MATQKVNQNVLGQNALSQNALKASPLKRGLTKTAQQYLNDLSKTNTSKNPSSKGWFDNKGFVIDKKA